MPIGDEEIVHSAVEQTLHPESLEGNTIVSEQNRKQTKAIRLSRHASDNAFHRGATEQEIGTCIRTARWEQAESDRLECRMNIPYNGDWNGKVYATKQVRPIFVEEKDEIVVVTVYVYYF
ncbi:MAG: hypothetical protein M1133_15830 [Armatimonadetes bacterium]|nr:hypothetical protein [Armatimonadota bacterium]